MNFINDDYTLVSANKNYGLWSKNITFNEENGYRFEYSRTCYNDGNVENFSLSKPDNDIEVSLAKQKSASELLNSLLASFDSLTYDDIIFFLYATSDLYDYMDTSLLLSKIEEFLDKNVMSNEGVPAHMYEHNVLDKFKLLFNSFKKYDGSSYYLVRHDNKTDDYFNEVGNYLYFYVYSENKEKDEEIKNKGSR